MYGSAPAGGLLAPAPVNLHQALVSFQFLFYRLSPRIVSSLNQAFARMGHKKEACCEMAPDARRQIFLASSG